MAIPEPGPYQDPMEPEVWVYPMFRNVLQVLASSPEATVAAFPKGCAVIGETIFGYLSHHESFLMISGKQLDKREIRKIEWIMDDLNDVRSRRDLDGYNESLLTFESWHRARSKAGELLERLDWDRPETVEALF